MTGSLQFRNRRYARGFAFRSLICQLIRLGRQVDTISGQNIS